MVAPVCHLCGNRVSIADAGGPRGWEHKRCIEQAKMPAMTAITEKRWEFRLPNGNTLTIRDEATAKWLDGLIKAARMADLHAQELMALRGSFPAPKHEYIYGA